MAIQVMLFYIQCLRYNICSAWFLDIRISTCFSRLPTILRKMAPWLLHVMRKCKRLLQQLRLHTHLTLKLLYELISTQTSAQQRLHIYAKSCVQKALEYFQHQLESSLQVPMSAFKAVQVFNPHKLATLKPDVSHVNSLQVIPAFRDSELESLKAELSTYIAKADGISSDLSALEWWKLNSTDLPSWSNGVKKS